MRNDKVTFQLESYKMDYSDLSRVIGEQLALRIVAQYIKKPFSENSLIQGCKLLITFFEKAGNEAENILKGVDYCFNPPGSLQLTDEEFYDPTDKGLTWIQPTKSIKPRNNKRKVAWRARRNG